MRDLSFIGSIFRFNFKGSEFSGAKITRVQPYKFARAPQKRHKGRYFKGLWHNYSTWIYPISAEFDFGLITETKIIKFYVQNAAKSGAKFKGYNFGEAGVDLKGIKEGETLNSREWRELSLIANITGARDELACAQDLLAKLALISKHQKLRI